MGNMCLVCNSYNCNHMIHLAAQQQMGMSHSNDALRHYGAGGSGDSGNFLVIDGSASITAASLSTGSTIGHTKPDRKKVLLLIGR